LPNILINNYLIVYIYEDTSMFIIRIFSCIDRCEWKDSQWTSDWYNTCVYL